MLVERQRWREVYISGPCRLAFQASIYQHWGMDRPQDGSHLTQQTVSKVPAVNTILIIRCN